MIKISDVKLSPFEKNYKKALAKVLKTKETDILNIEILRKSLDCRKRDFMCACKNAVSFSGSGYECSGGNTGNVSEY